MRVPQPHQGSRHQLVERGGRGDDDVAVGLHRGPPAPGALLEGRDWFHHAVDWQGLAWKKEEQLE